MGKWNFPFMGLAVVLSFWQVSIGKASILNQDVTAHQEAKIRVRLAERIEVARFRGFDLELNLKRQDQVSEWRVTCGGSSVYLQKTSGGNVTIIPKRLDVRAMTGFMHFQGRLYRDHIIIYPHPISGCEIINTTSLEKYLEGLVNAEFSSRWNAKAVAAQVIAARTYALYKVQEARSRPDVRYDLDSTEKDQVYDGAVKEDYRAAQIVSATRGQVLMAQIKNNIWAPLKAFYHSTCGGQTTLPEKVWGTVSAGFKRKVKCAFCRTSPVYKWNTEIKHSELEAKLKQAIAKKDLKISKKISNALLLDIYTEKDQPTQRIQSIISVWGTSLSTPHSMRIQVSLTGNEIRQIIGTRKLKSTSFNLSSSGFGYGRKWKIVGYGNGHGVGLCQWGAKVMAEKGIDTKHILSYYYPDAEVRKVW